MTLMRDVQGSAAQKLAMFEKVRGAGGFAKENAADLAEAEKMLREFAAMEKGKDCEDVGVQKDCAQPDVGQERRHRSAE